MTRIFSLLLFIGLAFNINSDLLAQRKSNTKKKKLTSKERVEVAKEAAKKEDTYQNQLEWTNPSSVFDTEFEWLDNLVKYFEIQTEKRNQLISAEASGNYIYCTAFYLDPKTSEKISKCTC